MSVSLNPLPGVGSAALNKANELKEAVGNKLSEVKSAVVNTATDLYEASVNATNQANEARLAAAKALLATGQALGTAAQEAGQAVRQAVGDAAHAAGPVIGQAAQVAGEVLGKVVDNAAQKVGEAATLIGGAVATLKEDYTALHEGVSFPVGEWKEKMALAEQGLASADPATRAAAQTLQRDLVGQQMAQLAAAVYGEESPEGWVDISANPEKLAQYGLSPADLSIGGSDFRARMFEPDPSVLGEGLKPVVSFKGTTSGEDWGNNLKQGLGMDSTYYERAVAIGGKLKGDVNIAGHSLGGGLASAAASASGKETYTFNAAGLHGDTLSRYNGVDQNPNITAYQVRGEILTGLQTTVPMAPEARGTAVELPTNPFRDFKSQEEGRAVGRLIGSFVGPVGAHVGGNLGASANNAVTNHLADAFLDGMRKHVATTEGRLRNLLENP